MNSKIQNEVPLPEASRARVARDMIVFQVKLFTDGVKDVLLSPLSLIAGLLGILLGRTNPGLPLYELLRFGKRIEKWINLFSAAYPGQSIEAVQPPATNVDNDEQASTPGNFDNPGDFDSLINTLQSSLMDPQTRTRLSEHSKNQLEAIAKKLRGDGP